MTRDVVIADDRPATEEIEITPEMIEAGAAVLYGFQIETTDEEWWAIEVYKAMRGEAPKSF